MTTSKDIYRGKQGATGYPPFGGNTASLCTIHYCYYFFLTLDYSVQQSCMEWDW